MSAQLTNFPSVIFRVDESDQIGRGHMSRCFALAQVLLYSGVKVNFFCQDILADTRTKLQSKGIAVVMLNNENSFFSNEFSNQIVIVDGYHFDEKFWHQLVLAHPLRTVQIDDFRHVRYVADLLICYNEGVGKEKFQIAPNTQLFLGGRYLLLRPEIISAAGLTGHIATRRALMIAAGGTNQELWLANMLVHLSKIESGPLWVLSGRRLAIDKVLHKSGLNRSRVRFFSNLNEKSMIRRYRQARCLFAPASTVMLEAFSAGCPIVSGWIAENQRNSLAYYDQQGLISNAGDLREIMYRDLRLAYANAKRRASQMTRQQRVYIEKSRSGVLEIVQAILKNS